MTRRLKLAAAAILAASILLIIVAWTTRTTDVSWTGTISDSACKKNHGPEAGSVAKERNCTIACVKSGRKYVFVNASNHKAYNVANQEDEDLSRLAGQLVSLTGVLKGSAVRISSLSALN